MESAVQAWLQAWWAPALAFAAGVVSFASPCVLPLIPGYLSFVSGGGPPPGGDTPHRGRPVAMPASISAPDVVRVDAGARAGGPGPAASAPPEDAGKPRPVAIVGVGEPGGGTEAATPPTPMLLFVLGFALVFTALGAFTATFQPLLRSETGLRLAGGVVLAFGLLMLLYALKIGGAWLYAERRPLLDRLRPGKGAALPLGMAFAAGWTPCIGPVLAGVLGVAAAQGGGAWGAFLMFSYSLGLGLPFVLVGLGARRLMGTLGFVKRNYHWFAGVGGAVMVLIGVLLILNLWQELLARTGLLRLVNGFTPPI